MANKFIYRKNLGIYWCKCASFCFASKIAPEVVRVRNVLNIKWDEHLQVVSVK